MKIKGSADWAKVEFELRNQIAAINTSFGRSEASTLIFNLSSMVNELSKLEVASRQSGRHRNLDTALLKVNEEIETVENLIFLGILSS